MTKHPIIMGPGWKKQSNNMSLGYEAVKMWLCIDRDQTVWYCGLCMLVMHDVTIYQYRLTDIQHYLIADILHLKSI